jgi:RNA polymerase sigma-70 factor, ECF subfamily
MVLRRAKSILGSQTAAEDAVQEVFMRLMKAEMRGEASMVTVLYRMTTNYCLNVIRDSKNRTALLERNPQSEGNTAGPTLDDRVTVQKLLPLVPEELREIAIYYYVDNMSVSRRTVGNRLDDFRTVAKRLVGAAEGQS